jgi:hypothetical protein
MPAVTLPTQLEAIVYDLRFAWRGLRRDRAFTLTAIATLTLVIAHSVGRRTREIGVRMAIGATVEDIRKMIFSEGMLPAAAG